MSSESRDFRKGRIEEIKARLEAATPTPWECDGFADSGHVNLSLYEGTNQGRVIASDITRNEDADLLFNAPTDIAFLLTELERAKESAWDAGCNLGLSVNPGWEKETRARNPYRVQP